MHPAARVEHYRANHELDEQLTLEQKELLLGAVAKIVAYGEAIGVSAMQMAELLRAGWTVRELLDYLAARTGAVA